MVYNLTMVHLKTEDGAVYLPVKVVPGASRTRSAGVLDDRLKIAVAAPPEKGKANAELIRFLARQLDVRRRDVTVTAGLTDPRKTVRIDNTTVANVRDRLDLDTE